MPKYLFHTTDFKSFANILKKQHLRPSDDGFISFSEKPFVGDISGNDISIAFDFSSIKDKVEKVEYTKEWADKNPEKVSYIAGEGWVEQFNVEEWINPSQWDEEEQEYYEEEGEIPRWAEDEAYLAAETESFLFKENEMEWVSKEKQPIHFGKKDIKGYVLFNKGLKKEVERVLNYLNFESLEDLNEQSVLAAGGVAGYTLPLGMPNPNLDGKEFTWYGVREKK